MVHRRIEKVYVSASSAEVERAQHWTNHLVIAGLEVTSTWLKVVGDVGSANPRDADHGAREKWSLSDLCEVAAADVVWFLVPPVETPTRGAWLEVGYARARDKLLVFSGDTKQSIFCALGDEFIEDLAAFATICRLHQSGSYK